MEFTEDNSREGKVRLKAEGARHLRLEGEQHSILVVDDDLLIRELVAKVLSDYRVLQADNGQDALGILMQEKVDVVLTDVMMPSMNGLDLLKSVKEESPDQAVVVMTGYADKEVILRALRADADDFINKPINLLQLKTTINKVLEKKSLKEELVRLKHMDRLKSEFLGLISHKLKTPITAISLFIQNLAQGIGDPDDPGFRKTLELILSESEYLGYLIQDLLYYSEAILQEGPPKLVATDLKELLLATLGEVRPTAAGKGVGLIAESIENLDLEMGLDRKRMSFAVRSLLDNAVKFTPRGGKVTLDVEAAKGSIDLVVRDNGPGIPPEALPRIFEKFFQVDPANTGQVRGFGLGLYYTRQFVQNHGGTIHMASEPGKGTAVTIHLPR
jgi:signal transduction histidine kinase